MKQSNSPKNEIDEAPPSYEEVITDHNISKPIPMTSVILANSGSAVVNPQTQSNREPRWYVNNIGQVLLRILIEFLRVPWAVFCFGWVVGTSPILILLFFPCIGIPLTFPVIYSWRMLAIAELVANKAICKMIAAKRHQVFDDDKFKIPKLAPIQSNGSDSLTRAWSRLFDLFTWRILFYYTCIALTTSLLGLMFFIYLLVMICFPLSWPFMRDVIKALDMMQLGLAYIPFVLLAEQNISSFVRRIQHM